MLFDNAASGNSASADGSYGVEARNHEYGERMSIVFCDDSKSSIYELPEFEPVSFLCGTSCANSPCTLIVEGAVAFTVGILLTRFVSHINSLLYEKLSPQIVLFISSSPILTFSVRGFSEKCITVAPTLKSLLNA